MNIPRIPLEGKIDLTYRCNNACRHCWISLPPDKPQKNDELTFSEIRNIVVEARTMGCRQWNISGGEPLLRPDFPEIFDYLTYKSVTYTLNTNGTLITPKLASLLTRKGTKMIALYGATAEVYDHVTRHPGGFEKLMQGFAYLKEAGAGFIVQLIPLRANYHQWQDMIALAKSLSRHWRCGAAWLYLSSDGSKMKNEEIKAQRLPPPDVIDLDRPDLSYHERSVEIAPPDGVNEHDDDRLFARCIAQRRDFHVDPYGRMSWCPYIQDPTLRYDLRRGSFADAWNRFIPSCADKVRGGEEWRIHCGSCESRSDCRWCPVYAYLETGRYSAPIPYLCAVAKEAREYKERWQANHRRYFRIAGITVRVESDLNFSRIKFKHELAVFAVDGPGDDNVTLRHHFELLDLTDKDLGKELYRTPPWAVSRKNGTWFYRGISPTAGNESLHRVAVFSADHTHGTIYSPPRDRDRIMQGSWQSLTLFPTDQIWLGQLLADRQAILLHSAAAVVNGKGLVFVGHSGAGKSTAIELLKMARRETGLDCNILCDDRNVVRHWPHGWRVHGTWSHGTTADVSPADASLAAILFLKQSNDNRIEPVTDRKIIWRILLATLIRPMVTAEWWQKELGILERLIDNIPHYSMHFDRSGLIVEKLVRMTTDPHGTTN